MLDDDCLLKSLLQKKIGTDFFCQGNLLDCFLGKLGIIVCSKWRFGDALSNRALCKVIGNFLDGDDKFLCRENLPNLMAQSLLNLLPPYFEEILACLAFIGAFHHILQDNQGQNDREF